MTTEEDLEKIRQFVLNEIERAKRPYADPFVLTSLAYCASKCVDNSADSALQRLQNVAHQYALDTFDVVTPHEALGRIEYLLMQ